MIPIEKEPKEFYENLRVYENCFFCAIPTDTWHKKTNKPVCEICAKVHKVSELKNSQQQ